MRQTIPVFNLQVKIHHLFDKQWFLLTSGDFGKGHYNTMTISWGSMGVMWNMPFVQVVVRPSRYTFEFMEKHETFTLCAFPKAKRKALSLLGAKSGRDVDKISLSRLTPEASTVVAAPCFAEAELVIECRKIYWQDLDPSHFLDPTTQPTLYPDADFHRVYFGEVLAVRGEDSYIA
jgi:flavin reductase (DIM6/NTAB) family NADH-FMN oxidoreductase RutF